MQVKLLLALGLAFVAGLLVFSPLFSVDPQEAELLSLPSDCNLNNDSVCQAQNDAGHQVSMSLSPRPVPLLKPVEIKVVAQGLTDIRTAQVSIEGVNMYMGVQIIPLVMASDQVSSPQVLLTGEMQLPVCTSQVMEWQATVTIQTANTVYRAAFPFTTTASS